MTQVYLDAGQFEGLFTRLFASTTDDETNAALQDRTRTGRQVSSATSRPSMAPRATRPSGDR